MRKYALSVREHSSFISLDDKHNIQIGEPLYPVAALESGRQVLVKENERFKLEIMISQSSPLFHLFILWLPFQNSWYRGMCMH